MPKSSSVGSYKLDDEASGPVPIGEIELEAPGTEGEIASDVAASLAWDAQVWGRATTAPGALDLTNFERHQAKVRFGLEF